MFPGYANLYLRHESSIKLLLYLNYIFEENLPNVKIWMFTLSTISLTINTVVKSPNRTHRKILYIQDNNFEWMREHCNIFRLLTLLLICLINLPKFQVETVNKVVSCEPCELRMVARSFCSKIYV